jgi:uncharacterized protein DUF6069
MITTSATLATPATISAPDRRLRAGAVGGALLATGAVWLVGHALGVTFQVTTGGPPQTFTLPFLLGFTLQVALAGWVTLAVLERYTRHAMGIWTALGMTVLALSFAPIAIAGASAPTKAALSLIHLSVAGVLLVTMRRSAARA